MFKCLQLQLMAQGSLTPRGSPDAWAQRWGRGLHQSNLGAVSFWVTPGTELFLWHFVTIHLSSGKRSVGAEVGAGWQAWVTSRPLSQHTSHAPRVEAHPLWSALGILLPRCSLLKSSMAAIGSARFSQPRARGGIFMSWCSMSSGFSVMLHEA